MQLEELLAEQSKELAIERVKLNVEGRCALAFAQGVIILIEEDRTTEPPSSFFLYSPVCKSRDFSKEELEAILSANLFHKETGNASFGFDSETKTLLLFQRVNGGISYPEYKSLFDAFVSVVQLWVARLFPA